MFRPRHAVLTLAVCVGFSTLSFGDGGVAGLKAAQDKSAQSGRPLIVVLGADWCPPCKKLEAWMKSDSTVKPVTDKFVYFHIDVDKEKDAYQAFTKKYPPPGGGGSIPMIFIIKSDGKMLDHMVGIKPQPKDMAEFFAKYAKDLGPAAAALTPKTLNLMKAAAKEAESLLAEGKFVSAYEKFADYTEELKSDNKSLTKIKATIKKIEESAIEKIASAKETFESAKSEAKRFDGAYQLTVIEGSLQDLEAVHKKAQAAISKLKEGKDSDLFVQAKLLFQAREAAREEDTAKAKKLYEKLIADYKGSEAAKRAKTRLDELEGGS